MSVIEAPHEDPEFEFRKDVCGWLQRLRNHYRASPDQKPEPSVTDEWSEESLMQLNGENLTAAYRKVRQEVMVKCPIPPQDFVVVFWEHLNRHKDDAEVRQWQRGAFMKFKGPQNVQELPMFKLVPLYEFLRKHHLTKVGSVYPSPSTEEPNPIKKANKKMNDPNANPTDPSPTPWTDAQLWAALEEAAKSLIEANPLIGFTRIQCRDQLTKQGVPEDQLKVGSLSSPKWLGSSRFETLEGFSPHRYKLKGSAVPPADIQPTPTPGSAGSEIDQDVNFITAICHTMVEAGCADEEARQRKLDINTSYRYWLNMKSASPSEYVEKTAQLRAYIEELEGEGSVTTVDKAHEIIRRIDKAKQQGTLDEIINKLGSKFSWLRTVGDYTEVTCRSRSVTQNALNELPEIDSPRRRQRGNPSPPSAKSKDKGKNDGSDGGESDEGTGKERSPKSDLSLGKLQLFSDAAGKFKELTGKELNTVSLETALKNAETKTPEEILTALRKIPRHENSNRLTPQTMEWIAENGIIPKNLQGKVKEVTGKDNIQSVKDLLNNLPTKQEGGQGADLTKIYQDAGGKNDRPSTDDIVSLLKAKGLSEGLNPITRLYKETGGTEGAPNVNQLVDHFQHRRPHPTTGGQKQKYTWRATKDGVTQNGEYEADSKGSVERKLRQDGFVVDQVSQKRRVPWRLIKWIGGIAGALIVTATVIVVTLAVIGNEGSQQQTSTKQSSKKVEVPPLDPELLPSKTE